jgi:hypothetical protein
MIYILGQSGCYDIRMGGDGPTHMAAGRRNTDVSMRDGGIRQVAYWRSQRP